MTDVSLNYNRWKSTQVCGNLYNSDYPNNSVLAHARFDRDVEIKNNLILGTETSDISDGVTNYNNSGGIVISYGGVSYTITPYQIIQLTQDLASRAYVDDHINNNILNQIDDIIDLLLLNQIEGIDLILDMIDGLDILINQIG